MGKRSYFPLAVFILFLTACLFRTSPSIASSVSGEIVGFNETSGLISVSIGSAKKLQQGDFLFAARSGDIISKLRVVNVQDTASLALAVEGLNGNSLDFDDWIYTEKTVQVQPFSVEVSGVEEDGNKAWIELGKKHGILKNMVFDVVRDGYAYGQAKVARVKESSSMLHTDFPLDLGDVIKGETVTLPESETEKMQESHFSIVINISKNKLFLYQGSDLLLSFPVATGRRGLRTPVGDWRIVNKIANPYWKHPSGRLVPPGASNPLGRFWLGLSKYGNYKGYAGQYGIHGTNQPGLIGRWVSHGCIRMHNAHISKLFAMVDVGTTVKVVR